MFVPSDFTTQERVKGYCGPSIMHTMATSVNQPDGFSNAQEALEDEATGNLLVSPESLRHYHI